MAKAIEDTLGDRITGGHVVDKKGHPIILNKISVTLGGHPVPDEDCVAGSKRILEITKNLRQNDLVFTCISNGVSSALTLPVPGISLEDVRKTTYILQLEHGVPTSDLNSVRNHIDMLKGGRISRYIQPAKAIHIVAHPPSSYEQLMYRNYWLHTLPDCTTFQLTIDYLKKWDAWDEIPASVREFLEAADPKYETVKAEEFRRWSCRIFGLLPGYKYTAKLPAPMKKADEFGFKPVILTDELYGIEASQAGKYMAAICKTIERSGHSFQLPCALFTTGEMVVTVGKEKGIGGGIQFAEGGPANMPTCLAGGIIDGETMEEAKKAGIDVTGELKRHNTSPTLWALKSGVVATPSISLVDLTVALVMGCDK